MKKIDANDEYAKGMSQYNRHAYEITSKYDYYQYRLFEKYLGNKICEIGSGSGRIANVIIKDRPSIREYTMIEPSPYFFSELNQRFLNMDHLVFKNGELKEFKSNYIDYFDSVFSVHVMEHIEDDKAFMADCFSITKKGGVIITLLPALQFLYSKLDKNIGHHRRYNKKMLRDLIADLDCEITSLTYHNIIGILPWLYFFKLRKIDYQTNESNKNKFYTLSRIFSDYFSNIVEKMENIIHPPIGLNILLVLKKR